MFGLRKRSEKNNELDNSRKFVKSPNQNRIVFNGEPEEVLVEKMKNRGSIDLNQKEYTLSPLGAIFVGREHKNSWIVNKENFMGWNVIYTDMPRKMIKFK